MWVGLRAGLAVLVFGLALAISGTAGSAASGGPLTPERVHVVADEASVLRALLRIEDSLTYDAVALRPTSEPIAGKIRADNKGLIQACNAIILDNEEITRAERHLHRPSVGQAAFASEVSVQDTIAEATAGAGSQLETLKAEAAQTSAADLFDMQILMAHLSQLSEMSTSVVSAANSSIDLMAGLPLS